MNFQISDLQFARKVFRLCYDITVQGGKASDRINEKALHILSDLMQATRHIEIVEHEPNIFCPHAGRHHYLLCQLVDKEERERQQ